MNSIFLKNALEKISSMTQEQLLAELKEYGLEFVSDKEFEKQEKMKQEIKREYRLYSFVNFYLSSIQQGIQTGHAAVDLVKKYELPSSKEHCDTCGNLWVEHEFGVPAPFCPPAVKVSHVTDAQVAMVHEWAINHKTFITLNGGNHAGIKQVLDAVSNTKYPFVAFHEDEQSLGGLMTAVAVVLPDDIFNMRKKVSITGETYFEWVREVGDGTITYRCEKGDADFEFISLLKSKDLAK